MCFVALHRHRGSLYVISNRDENIGRKSAAPPRKLTQAPYEVVMPTDGAAGGTWIGVRNDGVAAVLFNGAWQAHQKTALHTESRGLLIPRLLQHPNPALCINNIPLTNTEPFSLLLVMQNEARLYRWNGITLHEERVDPAESPCWSSVTLYNLEQSDLRKSTWLTWLNSQTGEENPMLENFTQLCKEAPGEDSIFMKRDNGIQTVSSTVVQITENHAILTYHDYLQNGKITKVNLLLTHS
ncbi:MAG: NRDE family protein [Chitinophagaceae bacterium]|nr:NRDE family protein [Chitinophagaceae bacterium]